MTLVSNKYPALRRAQEWLAAHEDPVPEPGTRRDRALKEPARAAKQPAAAGGRGRVATGQAGAGAGRAAVDISHHERHCTICQHPEREAIEEAFLDWRPISNITDEFKLPGRTAIYRHAHAFGLFLRRSRNLRAALGMIIEKAQYATATGEAVVSAVRAYTRVTDAGEWVEPPSHVIVSSGSALLTSHPSPLAPDAPAAHESPLTSHESQVSPHESQLLIPTPAETEHDATP